MFELQGVQDGKRENVLPVSASAFDLVDLLDGKDQDHEDREGGGGHDDLVDHAPVPDERNAGLIEAGIFLLFGKRGIGPDGILEMVQACRGLFEFRGRVDVRGFPP